MRGRRALRTAQTALWLLLATCGCSLDDRQLVYSQGRGGSNNTAASGGADAGAAEVPHGGGASAGGAGPTDLIDGCADLDTDGVADCKATLLTNPSFTSDVSGWTAVANVNLTWEAKNPLKDAPSGSARLRASSARAGAAQCAVVDGQQLVIAYANAFVAAPTDATSAGHAQLEVSYFDAQDCSGDRTGFFETPTSAAVDAWVIVQAGGVSLAGTRSALVALIGLKPTTGAEVDVYFDNVMLKTQALSP